MVIHNPQYRAKINEINIILYFEGLRIGTITAIYFVCTGGTKP